MKAKSTKRRNNGQPDSSLNNRNIYIVQTVNQVLGGLIILNIKFLVFSKKFAQQSMYRSYFYIYVIINFQFSLHIQIWQSMGVFNQFNAPSQFQCWMSPTKRCKNSLCELKNAAGGQTNSMFCTKKANFERAACSFTFSH